jgi:type II secretory pathway component GspD/PulD (secretin)
MRSLFCRLVGIALIVVALSMPATARAQGPSVIIRVPPTTVIVPDGGTTLVSGITQYSESGSQFGAPILGKIPVIDRGFTNVGYGRSVRIGRTTASVRIIDLAEEEFRQTGYRSR